MILKEARGWIGTEFRHQGRLRRGESHAGGVDCLGLLIGVSRALCLRGREGRLIAEADWRGYGRQPDGEMLRRGLSEALEEADGELRPGDVALMRLQGRASHVGFISDYAGGLGLIHAYAAARGVVEHRLDAVWRGRIVAGFRLPAG